jgi:hypothetical protein
LQRHVGDAITILCDVPTSLLDTIGVRDARGAPWYDRLLFGAARRDISMPAALVIDASGRVVFAHRSTRVDDRPAGRHPRQPQGSGMNIWIQDLIVGVGQPS